MRALISLLVHQTARKSWVVLGLLFCMVAQAQVQDRILIGDPNKTSTGRARVTGVITSKEDGKPLFYATIGIRGQNTGDVTNDKGEFKFTVAPGFYVFVVQYVGKVTRAFDVQVVGNGTFNVVLENDVTQLEQVTIEAEEKDKNVTRISAGVNKLSIREIESLPTFLGEVDVVKSLQTLPGVSTVGEGASGFNVRGGRTDQNLILQDGAIMFNASHVLGFFSSFNPDATETFTLYKGNMPAQFGGRVSSVLDVRMKEGNNEKIKVKGGLESQKNNAGRYAKRSKRPFENRYAAAENTENACVNNGLASGFACVVINGSAGSKSSF